MRPRVLASFALALAVLAPLTRSASLVAQQAAAGRRIWSGAAVNQLKFFPSPSPDGKWLAFGDMATGELAIRNVVTGDTRRLTTGAWDKETSAFASWTAFSRDGKQIAFEWYNDSNPSYELRLVGVDGGAPRVIRHPSNKGAARPVDWTPDGRYVVAVVSEGDQSIAIELVPVLGGTPRRLKSFADWRRPRQVRVSPDGRFLAYDGSPRKDATGRNVFVLAADGSGESSVISWPGENRFVDWTSDGRLLFTSDRAGSPAVWTLRVENGRPIGEPLLVRKDLWRSLGFDVDGNDTFYYVVETGDRDVFSASYDVATGKLLSKPVGVTQRPGERHSALALSADGRSLAYLTNTSPKASYDHYTRLGGTTITIQPLTGGQSRTLRPALAGILAVRWGPNDKSLVAVANDSRGNRASFNIDLRTGEASSATLPAVSYLVPNSQSILGLSRRDTLAGNFPTSVTVRKVSDGDDRELYVTEAGHAISSGLLLSPDGRWMVFSVATIPGQPGLNTRLVVLPTEGGTPRDLVAPETLPGAGATAVSFTPDGKWVLLTTFARRTDPAGEPGPVSRLWRIPFAGGTPEEIVLGRRDFQNAKLSPDGRRITFLAGTVSTEVWVLESPKPSPKGARVRLARTPK